MFSCGKEKESKRLTGKAICNLFLQRQRRGKFQVRRAVDSGVCNEGELFHEWAVSGVD